MNKRIWLCALLLLCSFATASADQVQTFEGIFGILYGDPDPASTAKARRIPVLNTDDGRWIELDLAGAALPPGGIPALVNKRIRVTGVAEEAKSAGAPLRLKAQEVQQLQPAVPKVTGNQKFLSVLCKFAGNTNEPRPTSFFLTQLGAAFPGFNHYYREASYGALTLDGSAVTSAWVAMPQPRTFYFDGVKQSSQYLGELFNDCTTAAAAIVNYSNYFGINLMFNDVLDDAAWGGGRVATLSGVNKVWPVTWMPYVGENSTFGWRDHGVLGHEMSHAFGAPHSAAPNGFEYGSVWDVVSDPGGSGYGGTCARLDATYGCISQSMNAYAKTTMEIMPASRVATYDTGTVTYSLERLAQPQNAANTFLVVQANIAGTATRFYTVESRFRVGYDAQLPGDGVLIHEVNNTRDPPAWLATPPGMPLSDGGMGPVWRPGMSFRSAADNIAITVNTFSADGTASVTIGPFAAPVDTWPDACAMPAGWITPSDANAGWAISSTVGAVGSCSLKSAPLPVPTTPAPVRADTQFTGVFAAGNATFFARASAAPGSGCLRFLVDGAQQNIGACAQGTGFALSPDPGRTETGWRAISVPITAGPHVLRWSFEKSDIDGGDNAAWLDSVVLPLANSATLTVAKAGSGTGGVSSSPSGIDCGATCSASFVTGTAVTLTATPGTGSSFAGWSGACSGSSTCVVTLNAAAGVTATFNTSIVTYALAVAKQGTGSGTISSVPAGLDCGATCTATFTTGTAVTLTATPAAGSAFAGWSGSCSGTSTCVVTLNAAASVTATFNASTASFSLTVAKQGTGTGTVSSAPAGVNCGSTCTATFNSGTAVTLTATPATGSVFSGWTGACSGTGGCTATINAATAVTATFSVSSVSYPVTVTKQGNGSGTVTSTPAGISCGATCVATFASGTVVSLAATRASDSTFTGWSGACTGTATCTVTMQAAKSVAATFTLATSIPRLANISTRMQVLTGDDVMIGGFIIGGSTPKTVVVRARGPSLTALGVPGALANPKLDLYSGQTVIASNDNWQSAANAAAITSSGFAPDNSQEAAILMTLNPGPYTAIVSGVGNTTGVGIVEVFEVDHPEVPLINIATRGKVLAGDNVLIGGFIIYGDSPQTVVVRARGPSLTALGVPGALANPALQLYSGQTVIASNDDWQTATNSGTLQASGFAPSNALESAILITLNPGAYTAIVTGAGGGTGVGIIEVFAQ